MSAAKPSSPNAEETTALQTHLFTKAMMTSKDSSYNFFFIFYPMLIQFNQQINSKHLKEKVH